MPEAPINKDGQSLLSKNEVGIAEKGETPPPSRKTGSPQEFHNERLCRFVAMPVNSGHQFGAFLFRDDVCHGYRKLFDFNFERHICFNFCQTPIVGRNDPLKGVEKIRLPSLGKFNDV